MRLRLESTGNPERYLTKYELRLAGNIGQATSRVEDRGKRHLRMGVIGAGLGPRLANAWRSVVFPVARPTRALGPTLVFFTKAENLISAYNEGVTIRHKGGKMLAIPTANVKGTQIDVLNADGSVRKRVNGKPVTRRRKMTPDEVEKRYGQKLTFIRAKRRGVWLAFIDKGLQRRMTLWRKKDPAARGAEPKPRKLLLMFILVKQVRLRKRLNVERDFATIRSWWLAEMRAATNNAVQEAA